MCEYCGMMSCPSTCPNFDPRPWTVFEKCAFCEEPILDGEDYVETVKGEMHYDCFEENFNTKEQIELLGGEVKTASVRIE